MRNTMIDFDNPNDMLDLRIKYKDDRTVIQMLNKIEDLQEVNACLKTETVFEDALDYVE